jgi:hypothetical protein
VRYIVSGSLLPRNLLCFWDSVGCLFSMFSPAISYQFVGLLANRERSAGSSMKAGGPLAPRPKCRGLRRPPGQFCFLLAAGLGAPKGLAGAQTLLGSFLERSWRKNRVKKFCDSKPLQEGLPTAPDSFGDFSRRHPTVLVTFPDGARQFW